MVDRADTFRAELREGYSVEFVAQKHGVSVATVKRHASYDLSGRQLLIGTEVHIADERGRWEFIGGIGYTQDGRLQYAQFRNTRTGRSRTFYTQRITTIHTRKKAS